MTSHGAPKFLKVKLGNFRGDKVGEECQIQAEKLLTEFQKLPYNLPTITRVREYIVLRSRKMIPLKQCAADRMRTGIQLPMAVLRLNFILVAPLPGVPIPDDLEAFICNSFDITCCCISMKLDSDLEMMCRYHNGAEEALQHNILQLTSCAVSIKESSLKVQMNRIMKYVVRGFRFRP